MIRPTKRHEAGWLLLDAPLPEGAKPIDLAGLCREAGWAFEARSDGALVVDLGVGGAYIPALVEARTSAIAVEASIVSPLPEAPERRAALAAFLLRANAAFRMMRAVLRERGDECEALLEAPLPSDANASDLSRALGAVAVAARHCAIEARMLADDERIARAYLNHWGGTLEPAP